MANYVLGFLFDRAFEVVVLIKKERPAWQSGRWNGVGGMVEPGESSIAALFREFHEETGLYVASWQPYLTEFFPEGKLEVFWAASPDVSKVTTTTDEEVAVWSVANVLAGDLSLVRNVAEMVDTALRCRET